MKNWVATMIVNLILSIIFQMSAWGSEVNKVAINSPFDLRSFELASAAASADKPRPCITVANTCYYKILNFKPIFIRSRGRWNESAEVNPLIKALDSGSLATILDYGDFVVKNLAADGAHKFMAELVFRYGPELQTNIVFGEVTKRLQSALVSIDAYADVNDQQELSRAKLKNFENIVNPGRDFQSVLAQVRVEDYRRAQAVGTLLEAWLSLILASESSTTQISSLLDIR